MSFLINPYRYAEAGFSPTDISGLWSWFDSSTITSDGSTMSGSDVTMWKNKEGTTARNMNQTSSTQIPLITAGQNGLDCIDPSPTALMTTSSGLTLAQPFTIICAGQMPANNSRYAVYTDAQAGGGRMYIGKTPTDNRWLNLGLQFTETGIVGTWQTLTCTLNSGTGEMFFGTTSKVSGTQQAQDWQFARFFDSVSTGEGWDGEMGEIIIYSKIVSGTELTDLQNYLIDKWGTP